MLLERLQQHTKLSRTILDRYAETASKRYRVYEVDKRDGTKRRIEHPSSEIKSIQRWLIRALIQNMPVHDASTAYSKGSSIRKNADRHVHSRYTVRLDFKEFFPSFGGAHVLDYLSNAYRNQDIVLSGDDLAFIRLIVCRNDKLTIGAPSSPGLTNAMMFDFDTKLAEWCTEKDLVYTRYADDIFVSAWVPGALREVEAKAAKLAVEFPYADLQLNREKTAHLSRKYKRSITGLVITPTQTISIGRDRKVRLKSDVYAYSKGKLLPEAQSRAAGMVAFVRDVEPTFYETLVRKYSNELLLKLQAGSRQSLKY
ncbi:retron St85 family RNA-directed DNA polymerase [Caulobacter sp. ErkDOM-YI]|uniref:retron St85 family RNA-directed DNA polymerase n=1 Tax=unclassified Caulobacter TaxID=2648921 RepID=UPI003AF6E724